MNELARALVTGASSGIGAAAVGSLAESGIEVLGVARRPARLEELARETGAMTMIMDVREYSSMKAAVEEFAPDILVNNAGVGHGVDGLAELAPSSVQEAVEVNVTAPVLITAAAIPGMLARGRGHIVNIGSIAGLHTMTSALYGSTKAAIHRFSQNLRQELAGTGIRVTEICPGRVTTEFYGAADGDRQRIDRLKDSGIRELEPQDIASAILFAINAPMHVNVSTIEILPTDQAVGGVRLSRTGA